MNTLNYSKTSAQIDKVTLHSVAVCQADEIMDIVIINIPQAMWLNASVWGRGGEKLIYSECCLDTVKVNMCMPKRTKRDQS